MKKSVSIITIHRIYNYGSIFQAFALQQRCIELGFNVQIIDYIFPNFWHRTRKGMNNSKIRVAYESRFSKLFFALALLKQHKKMRNFVKVHLLLSKEVFNSPDELITKAPISDIYITGSDQVWNPKHCYGDPSFFLNFAPKGKKLISYAASFGVSTLDENTKKQYADYLTRYDMISVREESGVNLVKALTNNLKDAKVVLDPTLLLSKKQWNQIAVPNRLIKEKYILCYFLNYSFNAFPYVDDLAAYLEKQTGYKIVRVARPPRSLFNINGVFRVGASPEEFLSLIRDAELVVTTSFHGTAFAVNFGKPLYSIVEKRNNEDTRQVSLLSRIGLSDRILEKGSPFPLLKDVFYDPYNSEVLLEQLRKESNDFLKQALYE